MSITSLTFCYFNLFIIARNEERGQYLPPIRNILIQNTFATMTRRYFTTQKGEKKEVKPTSKKSRKKFENFCLPFSTRLCC